MGNLRDQSRYLKPAILGQSSKESENDYLT